MGNYKKARVRLRNTQLNKLKSAAKKKIKKFQDDKLSHELFSTRRQKTKIRNTFANNMSTNVKLCKTQLPKIFQSGDFLGKTLVNLGKNSIVRLCCLFG